MVAAMAAFPRRTSWRAAGRCTLLLLLRFMMAEWQMSCFRMLTQARAMHPVRRTGRQAKTNPALALDGAGVGLFDAVR
jgi:hypothetical protein